MSGDDPHLPPLEEKPSQYRRARHIVRSVMGFTVIVIGLVLAIPGVPGPGFLIIIGGLAILATEYVWARRYLKRLQDGGEKLSAFLFRRKRSKPPTEE